MGPGSASVRATVRVKRMGIRYISFRHDGAAAGRSDLRGELMAASGWAA